MRHTLKLAIVTCTTNADRARLCTDSWRETARGEVPVYTLRNGGDQPYLGSVPAFRRAVNACLQDHPEAEVIACFHDDLEILESGWDERVLRAFEKTPAMGLAGFGGALDLGHDQIYHLPYDPMQLARAGFRSNLVDAEAHGVRSVLAERVSCLDGFSQIGRRAFWEGAIRRGSLIQPALDDASRPWTYLEDLGLVHHAYDSHLGVLAKRNGWETWYLPVRCRHYGGQTAVGDPGYQTWAQSQVADGDRGFWKEAHRLLYDDGRDVLPLRA